MLTAHLRQARTLQRRVRGSERLWIEIERLSQGLPERAMNALFEAAMGFRIRNTTYRALAAEIGEEISEQTAGRDLRQLVDAHLLVAYGAKRGRYDGRSRRVDAIRQVILRTRGPRDDTDPFAP